MKTKSPLDGNDTDKNSLVFSQMHFSYLFRNLFMVCYVRWYWLNSVTKESWKEKIPKPTSSENLFNMFQCCSYKTVSTIFKRSSHPADMLKKILGQNHKNQN